ncbi:hypothetical protein ACSQ67_013715 [Phaseolus vulgaris]
MIDSGFVSMALTLQVLQPPSLLSPIPRSRNLPSPPLTSSASTSRRSRSLRPVSDSSPPTPRSLPCSPASFLRSQLLLPT